VNAAGAMVYGRAKDLTLASEEPPLNLAKAYKQLSSMPTDQRDRMMSLIRMASETPLTDAEAERIAAILWATRGEGAIASLEAGYKLFSATDDAQGKPRSRRQRRGSRSIDDLNNEEFQALLANLLANRHVAPQPEKPKQ
jgi:hypothetical protein